MNTTDTLDAFACDHKIHMTQMREKKASGFISVGYDEDGFTYLIQTKDFKDGETDVFLTGEEMVNLGLALRVAMEAHDKRWPHDKYWQKVVA